MDNEDKKCVVCLEYSTTQTDCHHTLCGACWNRLHTSVWGGRQTPKCPYCRKDNINLTIPIELTEEEKKEHYDTLLEYYNIQTKILPNPPTPVYQPAPAFAPLRIPEGQGLRPEPPRPVQDPRIIEVAAELEGIAPAVQAPRQVVPRVVWNVNLPPMPNYLLREHQFRNANGNPLDYIKYVGFEAHPLLLALPNGYAYDTDDRRRAIKDSYIIFIVKRETMRQDIEIMNSVFDVRLPAIQRCRIYLDEGILPEAIPFNCRPMNTCVRCNHTRTRRICPRCCYTPICQRCVGCGDECHPRTNRGFRYYYIDLLQNHEQGEQEIVGYNRALDRYNNPLQDPIQARNQRLF